jgi:hypothetical protein
MSSQRSDVDPKVFGGTAQPEDLKVRFLSVTIATGKAQFGNLISSSLRPMPSPLKRSQGFGQRLSSGTFHHGSLDDNACGHIFPERYQQLARQRHDCRL